MREAFDIAVLATGSELLSGELSDTNTAEIAALLARHGFALHAAMIVGDSVEAIGDALQQLVRTHRVVIVTGGLGPTGDDLTAAAAARATGQPLQENPEAAELVAAHFSRIGRPMPAANRKQSQLPQGCTVLPNPCGTAPGFCLQLQQSRLFFLPGVPAEMRIMLDQQVLPRLIEATGQRPAHEEIHLQLFGLSEPAVEKRLQTIHLPEPVEVGFGVEFPNVILKLRSSDTAALQQAGQRAAQSFADVLLSMDKTPAELVTAELLIRAGLTLSLAESCTGGLIAARLTEAPGASAFLERGAVCYANNAKQDWLGVPATILDGVGAVSAECAEAMARGIRTAAGTDLGLAVTGIAGPGGGTAEKPVGTVYLALAAGDRVRVEQLALGGSRQRIRELTLATALAWLRSAARAVLQEA